MRTGWISELQNVSKRALAIGVAAGLVVNGFAPAAFADDAAPAAPPAAAAPADKSAQETVFWQSVEKSNSVADYKAYLAAFPNGIFAPLAKNRIEALSAPAAAPANSAAQSAPAAPADAAQDTSPPQPAPPVANAPAAPQPQPGLAMVAPQAPMPPSAFGPPPEPPSPDALKAEIGTVDTEAALDMGPPARMEVQLRLQAIGLYTGPIDGDLGPGARAGIAEWQKRHDLTATGELGPLEIDQLRIDSEPQYDILLVTRAAAPRPVYFVHRAVVTESAAPVALGILGAVAAGFLAAKLGGGGRGHGGKGGGREGKKKIH